MTDQRLVYVSVHRQTEVYHTEKDCDYLQRAEQIVARGAELVTGHKRQCRRCAGAETQPSRKDRSHLKALKAAPGADD